MKIASVLVIGLLAAMPVLGADKDGDDDEDPVVAAAVGKAAVSLEQGLAASVVQGRPISAKYELEAGALQLSIYTTKGDEFFEVIVDHRTGRIGKVIPIVDGDDLKEAREQRELMANAKRTLQDAAGEAVAAHKDFRAVAAIPQRKDGRVVASVLLTNGKEWAKVRQPLDWGE